MAYDLTNLTSTGYCNICDDQTAFHIPTTFSCLREKYRCQTCDSMPRERALMKVLSERFPQWRQMHIHESSPDDRGVSKILASECANYTGSQYYPDETPGKIINGYRAENLEDQTFESELFDLVITQDVMEHIFHPDLAFKEIARTLKPGGAHLFTVPLINKHKPTQRTATMDGAGTINYLKHPPEYHGNPVSDEGSLVTLHWGYDILGYIYNVSSMTSELIYQDNPIYGLRGDYIEVIISKKAI